MSTFADRLRSEAEVCWVVTRKAAMLEAAETIDLVQSGLFQLVADWDDGDLTSLTRENLTKMARRLSGAS